MADVERDDLARAPLQEAVGEPSGRRTGVERPQPVTSIANASSAWSSFSRATADESRRRSLDDHGVAGATCRAALSATDPLTSTRFAAISVCASAAAARQLPPHQFRVEPPPGQLSRLRPLVASLGRRTPLAAALFLRGGLLLRPAPSWRGAFFFAARLLRPAPSCRRLLRRGPLLRRRFFLAGAFFLAGRRLLATASPASPRRRRRQSSNRSSSSSKRSDIQLDLLGHLALDDVGEPLGGLTAPVDQLLDQLLGVASCEPRRP